MAQFSTLSSNVGSVTPLYIRVFCGATCTHTQNAAREDMQQHGKHEYIMELHTLHSKKKRKHSSLHRTVLIT
jgi:hypothetical protein